MCKRNRTQQTLATIDHTGCCGANCLPISIATLDAKKLVALPMAWVCVGTTHTLVYFSISAAWRGAIWAPKIERLIWDVAEDVGTCEKQLSTSKIAIHRYSCVVRPMIGSIACSVQPRHRSRPSSLCSSETYPYND